MDGFAAIFTNPPDESQPTPLYNKPATIYGSTLSFHILTWAAIAFRLYTRFRVVRKPGWDDYLIILSGIFNLISLISIYGSIHVGLGKHLYYVGADNFIVLFKYLYLQTAAYYTCTGLIKLSLLAQYLRLFKKGIVRNICLVLTALTSLWAAFWFFQGWFPCFPVSGFWNRTLQAKCWGSGYGNMDGALITFVAFAATNMILDVIIFFLPMSLYFKPGLNPRQILALITLFSLGSVVLLMSILRLWTAIRHNKNNASSLDFTWWYPLTMIIASLEIDFAIICASIPIFWPVIVAALPQIFVTQEVRVTHHQRLPDNYELGRTYSVKSNGGDSQENLTKLHGQSKTDYGDQFVADHVTGKLENQTEVVGQKQKKKW